jgi:phosphatidate cytidylyltransferase
VPHEWSIATVLVLVLVLAVGSVWGDLTEGFIKRELSVRPVGRVLPGFGAILDRVDSLLMALPLAYYALLVTLHLTR